MASAAPRSSPSQRIPEIDEIVDAQLFANRLIERAAALAPLIDDGAAGAVVCGGVDDMLARLSDMARESGETPPP